MEVCSHLDNLRKELPVPNGKEAGSALEMVWMLMNSGIAGWQETTNYRLYRDTIVY
jgi:hypothetical protein